MMKRMLVKHMLLPIPDLLVSYEIDPEKQVVHIDLGDHFDSSLLLSFAQTLFRQEGVRTIDDKSHNTWSRAIIDDLYAIELTIFGQICRAEIMQLLSMNTNAPPEYAVCLFKKHV
jgi:hypothetical protein